jgi:hypothetical protein
MTDTDADTNTDTPPNRHIKTHPHVATVVLDPAQWFDFERTFEDRPEVKILKLDRGQPDDWTVYAACASDEVRKLLERNW